MSLLAQFEPAAQRALAAATQLSQRHPLAPPFMLLFAIAAGFPVLAFLGFAMVSVVIGLIVFAAVEIFAIASAAVILFWALVIVSFCVGSCFFWAVVVYQVLAYAKRSSGLEQHLHRAGGNYAVPFEKRQQDDGSGNTTTTTNTTTVDSGTALNKEE